MGESGLGPATDGLRKAVTLLRVLAVGRARSAALHAHGVNAHRVARGHKPCSPRTGAYCRARQRLPEEFLSAAACSVGRGLDAKAERGWRWKGRRVYLFDGTTVTMPDTPANRAASRRARLVSVHGEAGATAAAFSTAWCASRVTAVSTCSGRRSTRVITG